MTGAPAPLRGAPPSAPAGAAIDSAADAAAGAAIDVAVGVVIRSDGAVLLGQRIPGKPYAGWWEFPGGKLEPGESVEQALVRELHEELGLEVVASQPWVVREFVYPHARVRLHFRRVPDFRGEPASREGQAFVWRQPDRVDVAPLLPATVPVIGWLRLPTLCLVCGSAGSTEERALAALGRALEDARSLEVGQPRARPIVVLAEPTLSQERFERLFYRVRALCSAQGARLLVSDRHPASFAQAADGAVVRAATLASHSRRPAGAIAAAWCANEQDLQAAARLGCDFALAADGCLAALARGAPLPALLEAPPGDDATRRTLDEARRAGAHGIVLALRLWQDAASGG